MLRDNQVIDQAGIGTDHAALPREQTIARRVRRESEGFIRTSAFMSSIIGLAFGVFGTTLVLGFIGTASLSALVAVLPIVMGVFLGGVGLLLGSFFDLETVAHSALESIDRFDKLLHTNR